VQVAGEQQPRREEADVVVGADGAYSVVRRTMQRLDRFDFSQSYLSHGYKELTIPAGAGGRHRIEQEGLHIWPRGGYMMIALPNLDGSFTCTLFWPFQGRNSFAALTTEQEVRQYFQREFPDAPALMPTLTKDYLNNPIGSLVTVRSYPWQYRGRVVMLGDACHAVVPFYGQGANAAFEDCVVLNQCLLEHGKDLERAFEHYQQQRKRNVDVLADLAIANFEEMSDRVSSAAFRFKKRLEKWTYQLFPSWFLPLYSMISFSRIPYAEALERHHRQLRLMKRGLGAAAAVALVALAAWLASRL
jgi:kynurenine 3-monooxygenase